MSRGFLQSSRESLRQCNGCVGDFLTFLHNLLAGNFRTWKSSIATQQRLRIQKSTTACSNTSDLWRLTIAAPHLFFRTYAAWYIPGGWRFSDVFWCPANSNPGSRPDSRRYPGAERRSEELQSGLWHALKVSSKKRCLKLEDMAVLCCFTLFWCWNMAADFCASLFACDFLWLSAHLRKPGVLSWLIAQEPKCQGCILWFPRLTRGCRSSVFQTYQTVRFFGVPHIFDPQPYVFAMDGIRIKLFIVTKSPVWRALWSFELVNLCTHERWWKLISSATRL